VTRADVEHTPPLATARVISWVPGRMRLRLTAGAASAVRLNAAVEALNDDSAVSAATPHWQTGSLLIRYDPSDFERLSSTLARLGLDLKATTGTAAASRGVEPGARVGRAVVAANGLVGRRAGGNDLRTLVPLGFGLLALRQFVRDDQRLSDAPWYLLAWYASETFQKFHKPAKGDIDG
jgi:hypothetical protein